MRVRIFTYAVTWVVRCNWWLILLMCLLCLNFKLNTGSAVDCDWLDQVGCYGNRSETACFRWNWCAFYVHVNYQVSSLLKQSGFVMWIWLCNHTIYNSPARAILHCRTGFLDHRAPQCVLQFPLSAEFLLLFCSVGKNMQLINVQTCMCVYINIHRHKPFEETLYKRLLCHLYWTLGISKRQYDWDVEFVHSGLGRGWHYWITLFLIIW